MFTLPDLEDIDDDAPESFGGSDACQPERQDAGAILAREALEGALTARSRAQLKQHPGLFIVAVPDPAWVPVLGRAVRAMDKAPMVTTITERKKSGGSAPAAGREELACLRTGHSVMFITQDPEGLLDPVVLASADLTLTIPPLTPELLRKVIRQLTGGIARGVTLQMARLDLTIILSVLRPELTARACVARLRRALERRQAAPAVSGPTLDQLPLIGAVREWSDQMLAELAAVKAGDLAPDRLLHGVLEGPPGTGKTLIARSLARTAGWTFVSSSVGSWFTSGDGALGGVARNLAAFINQVLASEPAIGFLDELEALPNRETMDNRARDWWTPVVTLFLTEIDRVRQSGRKVLLLGASNYYDRLDAALIRPGRLQQRIQVLPPSNEDEVVALLRYYLGDVLTDADLGKLARLGRSATPATVEGWVKQARSRARAEGRDLDLSDLMAQMVPRDTRSPADIRAIALHELGHAVVAFRLGMSVETVSILPEGGSGGRTLTRLTSIVPTRKHIADLVTLALGGRAADVVVGCGANAGAEGDLAQATELLLAARERQGLDESLVSRPVARPGLRSEALLGDVEAELKRLLQRAITIIEADRALVLTLADKLIADKLLSGSEITEALAAETASRSAAQPADCAQRHGMPSEPDAAEDDAAARAADASEALS